MSDSNKLAGAYLVNGTIGNVGMKGAPILNFSLVVVPSKNSVSGTVHVTQAVEGGSYSGHVTGKIHATGLGPVTQIVSLKGMMSQDSPVIGLFPIEANMAINSAWEGEGGFSYLNVHVEKVPVKPIK